MTGYTGVGMVIAAIGLLGCSGRDVSIASTHPSEVTPEVDAGASFPEVTYPVPVRPTPPDQVQPGTPVNLAPTPDCTHPEVQASCSDGFCVIPPGCFVMGAPRDQQGAAMYADVQVQVTLTHKIEMGEVEVTNDQWLAEGFELPSRDVDVARCTDANCPVTNVNFFEAVTFLNRYSERRGLKPCLVAWRAAFPT